MNLKRLPCCLSLVLSGLFLCAHASGNEEGTSEPGKASVQGEPATIILWPDGAPGALGSEEADVPALTAYFAPETAATGAAMIIGPGGGYHHLAAIHGEPIAHWLNSIGISAFVLKYRHLRYQHPAPLQDAQQAIRTVRARAGEWQIDPHRIGILGFSAGGHLAAMAGTLFDLGDPESADPIRRVSCRPDVMVLCVPVITMRPPYAHAGSVQNLLGETPKPDLVSLCSPDEQVRDNTPPAFIVSTFTDETVAVENSLRFASALREAHIPCELHVYEQGPHNFLRAEGEVRRILDGWQELCAGWLRLQKFARAEP